MRVLTVPTHLINLFTLLTGFVVYPFFIKMSSDAIAITFFLGGLYFALQLVTNPGQRWLQRSIGMSVCLIACASMKFLYVPVIAILPGLLLIKSFTDNNTILKKAAAISSLIVFIGVLSLLTYQKSISGDVAYIAQTKKGFYTENLLSAYPVAPASFVNPETVGQFLHQPYEDGSTIYRIYQCINIVLCLVLFSLAVWVTIKKGVKNKSGISFFFYLLFFTGLTITVLLSILSLKFAKEFDIWTYVQEARYYGIITVMLQLAVFILYYYFRNKKDTRVRYVFYLLIILLLPEMFRGMLFTANRIINFRKEEYTWQSELKLQKFAAAIIEKEQHLNPVDQVVLAGSSPYMNNRVCLYSHVPLLREADQINDLSSLNTKTSVLLLVMLRADARANFESFLSLKEKKEAGQMEGFYFYTVYVKPH